jgi:hypothetical protein
MAVGSAITTGMLFAREMGQDQFPPEAAEPAVARFRGPVATLAGKAGHRELTDQTQPAVR